MSKSRTPEMMNHLRCDHCGEASPSLADKLHALSTQLCRFLEGKSKEEWDPEILELGGEIDGKAEMLWLLENEVLDLLEFYRLHPERLGPKQ